jgi:2-polyprenyl-6-methoxyphenol hydroxylase-like FAD-dependent oxidoreductase
MAPTASSARPRVVIIGCGFGGLEAARALRDAPVDITLVDRTNHHLFQPLLYQVATAGLSAPAIAAPVRHLFRKQANVTTLLGEVSRIDARRAGGASHRRRRAPLRPPDRRRRRHPQLLRPRRVGARSRPG